MHVTQLLISGAGPFGLATAAYAKYLGIDVTIVGKSLHFWKAHMPRGMFLRSDIDWHLDAREIYTFEAYVDSLNITPSKPVSRELFCDYVSWFTKHHKLEVVEQHVTHLLFNGKTYIATLQNGSQFHAYNVLLCLGFAYCRNMPDELIARLPKGSWTHTCDMVEFETLRGKRVMIVGGRQSAFEWAALIHEAGAEAVHVVHRHATPRFEPADWSWVQPMTRLALQDHSWWRNLPSGEREAIYGKYWATGRLVLEPWLKERVYQPNIHHYERTNIQSVTASGENYRVELDQGKRLEVDHFLLATGYRPNMENIHFLDRSSIADRLHVADGSPVLDPEFQTNLPGLYITGIAAMRDFGPSFGFTVACPVAAKIIAEKIVNLHSGKTL